ncbi:MAG TPA: hypothetical protein VK188_17205 [Holophaga sp.]|nr:hypothetical protein [Holophaga sp.]
MLHPNLLLIPVLVAPATPTPDPIHLKGGLYVLRGVPDAATLQELRVHRFTHVLDLRQDGEDERQMAQESAALAELGIQYLRYAIPVAPPAADFDFLRQILRTLPQGARVLVHCGDGNRASAAVCVHLILDLGMKSEKATALAHDGGLSHPETLKALAAYLAAHARG